MFERMLAHPNITIRLETAFEKVRTKVGFRRMIYTGPIDEFFAYRFGRLPYRSLKFEHVTLDKSRHQPVAVVNYPQTNAYTRSLNTSTSPVSSMRRPV